MIYKKKKKNIIFINFLKNLSFKYKNQINNILDIKIIEDNQIDLLKEKLFTYQRNLKNFLGKRVISTSQIKKIDGYLSFIYKEKITSEFNLYFSKIK